MRNWSWLTWIITAAALGGCSVGINDSTAPGPVEPGLYRDAVLVDRQRLAGEDVRIVPLYKTPLEAIGVGFDVVIGQPIVNFFDYVTKDNAEYAARNMADKRSADKQREGMLRLTDFKFARKGIYIKGYFLEARDGEDFTIRAAGIRALNRCRAKGFTTLFIEAMDDDEPLIQLEAADALGNIPDPRATPLLVSHMEDPATTIDVRIACADALRCYNTPEVTNALVGMLEDTNFGLAWQARQSLQRLTGQDFRYDTKAWLNYLATAGT